MENDQAKLLLGNAVGFHLAAKRIVAGGTGVDFPWPPFFAIIGYAFELSLKAYILQRGGTEKDCLKLGHDLLAAMNAACTLGLQRPSKNVTDLLTKIGCYHCDHSFRYMKPVEVKGLPSVTQALDATNCHLQRVADQLSELLPT